MEYSVRSLIWTIVVAWFGFQVSRLIYRLWWIPHTLKRSLSRQGIKGPARLGPLGNMVQVIKMRYAAQEHELKNYTHDILHHVFPDHGWLSQTYGDTHLYWWATEPRVNIQKPELLREVLGKTSHSFHKSTLQLALLEDILGRGTVASNGEEWSFHRRMVSPAFHMEKLKMFCSTFVDCTSEMLERWREHFEPGKLDAEIEASEELSKLTADAIARTAFGGSYERGRRAFEILNELIVLHIQAAAFNWIPFSRLFPIKLNRDIWVKEREVNKLLYSMVEERKKKFESGEWASYGEDLLGMILSESGRLGTKAIIGECKTMHVAGSDTTASLLTWTLFLLAVHPEWQDQARAEVLEVCGRVSPDMEAIGRMKQVVMILNESLRLYPPAGIMFRESAKEVQIGDMHLPKGVGISIPVIAVHHDAELWGDDAKLFNPRRFEQGVSKAARHSHAFMPFSYGPRVCLGMNFAVMEAKVALAMILQEFEFSVSPKYRHSPFHWLTLKPNFGMQLIIKRCKPH